MTPTYAWPLLAAELGTEVWVKHENTTPTGAFKMRGGLVLVERLAREAPDLAGIVSATRGNHGQSLAFAGGLHGVPVTIVVPEGNSTEKNAAMVALGAELVIARATTTRRPASTPSSSPNATGCGWSGRSSPTSCSAWRRTPSSCSALGPTSTSSTCRSGWARASAA